MKDTSFLIVGYVVDNDSKAYERLVKTTLRAIPDSEADRTYFGEVIFEEEFGTSEVPHNASIDISVISEAVEIVRPESWIIRELTAEIQLHKVIVINN